MVPVSKRVPGLHPIGPIVDEVIAAIVRRWHLQHPEKNKLMTEQELESLKTIIRYLWRDEQKDFEACELNDGGPPDNHIFSHLETLRRYLTQEQAANVSPFI